MGKAGALKRPGGRYHSAMTKLEATIERLRAAPRQLQELIAAQIESALTPAHLLSDEELAEIAKSIDESEVLTPHEEVVRQFRERFGE